MHCSLSSCAAERMPMIISFKLFEGTSLNTTFTLQACMDFEIKGLFFTLFSASFISILLLCYVIAPPYAAGHKLLLLLFLDEVVIAVGDSIRFVADETGFMLDLEDRRCLIPASCYYEWQKSDGRKIKYAIKPM